jgi:hypothetical protein
MDTFGRDMHVCTYIRPNLGECYSSYRYYKSEPQTNYTWGIGREKIPSVTGPERSEQIRHFNFADHLQ